MLWQAYSVLNGIRANSTNHKDGFMKESLIMKVACQTDIANSMSYLLAYPKKHIRHMKVKCVAALIAAYK